MTTVDQSARAILDFWFGLPGEVEPGRQRPEWFRKDAAFDADIERRFGAVYREATGGIDAATGLDALPGRFRAWLDRPDTALALILLLDQFPRNMYRDSAAAFASDGIALAAARETAEKGHDRALPPVQRMFVYLPFEHSEDIVCQEQSVAFFTALGGHPEVTDTVDYARRHRDIVARFGRFPHRNAALGRRSTVEEVEFLKQPGSRF